MKYKSLESLEQGPKEVSSLALSVVDTPLDFSQFDSPI